MVSYVLQFCLFLFSFLSSQILIDNPLSHKSPYSSLLPDGLKAAKLPMSIIIVGVGQAEFDGKNQIWIQQIYSQDNDFKVLLLKGYSYSPTRITNLYSFTGSLTYV